MKMLGISSNSHAADEALRWFVRLHSGDCTGPDRRAFNEWLASRETHRLEYQRVVSLWTDMDGLKREPFPELDHARLSGRSVAMARLYASGVMAAILTALIVGAWWWTTLRVVATEYRTAKGEQRTVVLPDGSTIAMNTDTALSVQLSGSRRTVVLREGEALFTVAHDAGAPFEVLAGGGRARDIGTQFAVHKQAGRVDVSVLEGLVEVEAHAGRKPDGRSSASSDRRVLAKGEGLWYTDDGRLGAIEPVDANIVMAWVHGKLIFESRPLAGVLREISRYRAGEIRLIDENLGALNVSGVFDVHDLEGFFRALEKTLPVKVTRVNGQLAIVEAAALGAIAP